MDGYSLKDKHLFVTGASSGIGRACAILFSQLGAHVTILARNAERLEQTLHEMEGSDNRAYVYDLSDVDGIDALVSLIVKERGKLDGMMYCAGDCYRYPLAVCKPNQLRQSMQINFFAFVETLRCVAKNRSSNNGASFASMSSDSSMKGDKALLTLSASKAAMNSAVRCAARELAERKIRVNAIAASYIGGSIMVEETLKIFGADQIDHFLKENQPLGMGTPGDVASAAAFLMSDASKFITGTIMLVDGGYMA